MRFNGKEHIGFLLPKCALVVLFLNYVNAMEFNYCQISPSHTLCQYAVSNFKVNVWQSLVSFKLY